MNALWEKITKLNFPGVKFKRYLNDGKIVGDNPARNSKLTISHDGQQFATVQVGAGSQLQVTSRLVSPRYAKTVDEVLAIIQKWVSSRT
jgi:hypothetical protein